jgi:hypothetical protein
MSELLARESRTCSELFRALLTSQVKLVGCKRSLIFALDSVFETDDMNLSFRRHVTANKIPVLN